MTRVGPVLPPRKRGLFRRRRGLSRGAQYLAFIATVVGLVTTADWGRLRNQFAQRAMGEQMFPEVLTC